MLDRPTPSEVVCDFRTGYSINVPAEWQDPNMPWWRDKDFAQYIANLRAARGIVLHDALWAYLNDQPEPDPRRDNYQFDAATQTYTRTDVRV